MEPWATVHCKTAVLCPLKRFDDAEFFALCAQNRGLHVCGFCSYEDAIAWLTETSEDASEAEPETRVAV